jgi:hypothetical protein
VLVQIALDRLLQGSKVIHVSFTQHADYVLTWYKNIFDEFLKKTNQKAEQDTRDEIIKNRVLMKFNQEGLTVDQIIRSLRAMIKDGGFAASFIIIDGYRFATSDRVNISRFKEFSRALGLSIWFSCNVPEEKMGTPVYSEYANLFSVIAVLEPKQASMAESSCVELAISRNRDIINPQQPALRLDPKTLLLLES